MNHSHRPPLIQRLAGAALLAMACTPLWASDVPSLLKAADRYRMASQNMRVETEVTVLQADGSTDKERQYTVYAQPGHQSLVLMRSPAEKGQKVLMLGDDFWLMMPSSRRPLRITATQKLLGDASTADIASLSWADDYTGTVVGEEPCGEPARACLRLQLQANRSAVTYQRIDLWIGKARQEPVKAELYLQSDKLAKHARFEFEAANPNAVSAMVLQDQLTNRKLTRVRYVTRQTQTVPAAWMNPMYLAANAGVE